MLKKSGIDLTISIETLSMKAKMWPNELEYRTELLQSIARFFACILSVEDLKTEISRVKME